MSEITRKLDASVNYIYSQVGELKPRVGVVLGSGLGAFANELADKVVIPYKDIPGFNVSEVVGHSNCLIAGKWEGVDVLVMQGRIHFYEGYSVADVVHPIRTLVRAGCQRVIITNAAGGIADELGPGDLALINDHLNLTGTNPLIGPNDDELGVRFPDMTDCYSADLRGKVRSAAQACAVPVKDGVYCGLKGPSYETPAEIRMLRAMGGDMVGMSTVLEAIAAHHMGAELVGISCISNKAAGLSHSKLTHEEVKEVADQASEQFIKLLGEAIKAIA